MATGSYQMTAQGPQFQRKNWFLYVSGFKPFRSFRALGGEKRERTAEAEHYLNQAMNTCQ